MIEMYQEEKRLEHLNKSQYRSNNTSARMVENKKVAKLSEIFDSFDTNGNGKLTAD